MWIFERLLSVQPVFRAALPTAASGVSRRALRLPDSRGGGERTSERASERARTVTTCSNSKAARARGREGEKEGERARMKERERASEREIARLCPVCPGPTLRPSCGRIPRSLAHSLARSAEKEERVKIKRLRRRLLFCLLRLLPDSVQCDVTCTIDPETNAQAERMLFPRFL